MSKDSLAKTEEIELSKGQFSSKVEEYHEEQSLSSGFDEFDKSTLVLDDEKIRDFFTRLSDESVKLLFEETGHGQDLNHDDKDDLTLDLRYILDRIINMTNERVLELYEKINNDHQNDANFPIKDWDYIQSVLAGELDITSSFEETFHAKLLATLVYYHSPYPEVRAVTDLLNDPTEPVETIRSYTIAIIWVIIAAGINEFFSHRQPSIFLSTSVVSILMYACGKAWEWVIPNWTINFFGKKLPLNNGPYSFKEQMFATLMVGSASGTVYVSSNILTQVKYYHQDWPKQFGFQFLLTISTQLMGFGYAGILRKFVVYPVRAMWPTLLPTIALNRALLKPERKEVIHGWSISKYKFFWITFLGMFCYYWIPGYLFQALSTFSWMTWIRPYNFNLDAITGMNEGLGLNPWPTFDWVVVSFSVSPLAQPFYVVMNYLIGAILAFFVIVGVYWSNYKWTAYLNILSNDIFTNTGDPFDVDEILTDGLLDPSKYQNYSPPFYTAANLVAYGAFFLFYPFNFLYNTYSEWDATKMAFSLTYSSLKESLQALFRGDWKGIFAVNDADHTLLKYDDPHSKMMSRYKETPDWCFWIVLLVSLILGIICVEVYPDTKTPVWGIFLAIAMNIVFMVPLNILYSLTGFSMAINVLFELIIGYALPGNGVALMTLKAYGTNIDVQAEDFVTTQKTAHYAKIPTRAIFRCQIIGVFIQSFVFLGVLNWSMANIDGMCTAHQKQKFTCPNETTYFSSSVLWGVIGPKRVFNGLYPALKYTFLIGFLLALLFIAVRRFAPKLMPKSFAPTVVIMGFILYSPYNLSYLITGVYFSFFFMKFIKTRYLAWFEKYNYILSAGLSAGVAFSPIIVFFAVQYHEKDLNWWGNNVPYEGIEGGYGQTSLKNISATARGYFGPAFGHFP